MSQRTALRRIREDLGELVARHESARDLSEFSAYASDPVGFIRDVLQGEPWSRQEEIGEAVRDAPLVAVRSCNGAGKDWLAARLALWWVYARGGLVLLTGPTERQVREVCMGEVARAFARARDLPGELYQMALRLGREDRGGILAFTSTEASRLTGFHAPRVLAVLTEAQGVEDFAWEGLLACATGSEDRVLAVGNPLTPSGRFHAASRSRAWRSVRISAEEHPNLREGREVIPGGPSREFVRRIAEEYGRGSGIYRARVAGEFPEQDDEGLFVRSWLDDAATRHAERRPGSGEPVVAVDPARYGPDSTVVAVRRGPVLEEFVAWGRCGTMQTVERVVGVLDRVGVRPGAERASGGVSASWGAAPSASSGPEARGVVVVDTVGLGGGVADRLRELGYRVAEFNAGAGAEESARFLNRRAETYWRLRKLLEAGAVALPPDEALAEELLATRWKPTADGKVQIEAKDDLRGRLGRSPDRADAAVMAFALEEGADVAATWGADA